MHRVFYGRYLGPVTHARGRRLLALSASVALVAGCGASAVAPLAQVDDPFGGSGASAGGSGESAALTASSAGRWVSAGTLTEARFAPEAVLTGDGKVLVVGDDGCFPENDGAGSPTAEAWAASTNRWQAAASLSSSRARFAAVTLRDGRVLVAGGLSSRSGSHDYAPFQSFSSAWTYDPKTGGWSRAGLMRQARTDPVAALLADGRVLVAGGYYAEGMGNSNASVDLAPADVPAIRLAVAPAVLADVDPPPPPDAPVLATAELYDPRTNGWSSTGHLMFARFGGSAVTLADGRVLVVGQRDIGATADNSLRWDARASTVAEIYDPRTGRFRLAGTLPAPMVNAALVGLADGGALLIGGRSREGGPIKKAFRFDPRSLAWTAVDPMATARTSAAAVRLRDGRVLVIGGFDAYGPLRSAELYDPRTGLWTSAPAMPSPRGAPVAVVLRDGSVLVLGGMGVHEHDMPMAGAYYWGGPTCPPRTADAVRFVPAR